MKPLDVIFNIQQHAWHWNIYEFARQTAREVTDPDCRREFTRLQEAAAALGRIAGKTLLLVSQPLPDTVSPAQDRAAVIEQCGGDLTKLMSVDEALADPVAFVDGFVEDSPVINHGLPPGLGGNHG